MIADDTQVCVPYALACEWRRVRAVVKIGGAAYNHVDKKPVRTIRCKGVSTYCINGDVLMRFLENLAAIRAWPDGSYDVRLHDASLSERLGRPAGKGRVRNAPPPLEESNS